MVGRLIIGIIAASTVWFVGTTPEAAQFAKVEIASAAPVEKMSTDSPKEQASLTEPLTASSTPVTEVEEVAQASMTPVLPAQQPVPPTIQEQLPVSQPADNETIAWNHFIAAGFSREQAAGILGNLQQEHGFKTSDVPGGLGIAQWLGGRRANLIAKGNYLDINVQLQFIVEELNGVEGRAMRMLQAATTVEAATIAFQDGYERCGKCMQPTRIAYAYAILGRH